MIRYHTVTPITVTHRDATRARAPHPPPRPYAIFSARRPEAVARPFHPAGRPTPDRAESPVQRADVGRAGVAHVGRRRRRRLGSLRSKTTARPSATPRRAAAAPPPPTPPTPPTPQSTPLRPVASSIAASPSRRWLADPASHAPAETVAIRRTSAEVLYGRVSADAAKAGESVSTSTRARREGLVLGALPTSLTPRPRPAWRAFAPPVIPRMREAQIANEGVPRGFSDR